ncbi:hypothetical protein FNV43_RR14394 [Rhamnella rubrinervis]|uniref:SAM domain-containing protein n=1 Tax=Rhamnella rubrinervis TaxID=2594499 RepID=A0A8K0H2V0_9ROSA|nr:hypothetical protein FNV43_RR14394 [Rhamnella rubrinervis]
MSNPRVTITLGRTGQVVERGGTAHGYHGLVSGTKRSMGEGFGSNANGFVSPTNKRRRDDGFKSSMGGNTWHDSRISQYDLRLKLMRKSLPKQIQGVHEENRRMDHRVKLSETVQPPLSHPMLQYKSETGESTLFRKIPPRESADDLFLVNSLRNSYSSRTPNGLRARSTERNLKTSSEISTPRSSNELWKVPPLRESDASRAGRFPSIGVVNLSRSTGPIPFTVKPILETVKRVAPASCSPQQNSHMVEGPLTVAGLLHILGLGKYTVLFQAEEVDMAALRQMGDKDLKELGIPMGPRKKILLALLPRRKPPPP